MPIREHQLEKLQAQWHNLTERTRRGRRDKKEMPLDEDGTHGMSFDDLSLSNRGATNADQLERAIGDRSRLTPAEQYLCILEKLWHAVVEPILGILNWKVCVPNHLRIAHVARC